ncbi:MAG: hypothetical protein KBE09_02695 [Candidatus Pacebacteria bacterium]|nr:hypothetical protein [Candidatus Paceibacterota bacterium]
MLIEDTLLVQFKLSPDQVLPTGVRIRATETQQEHQARITRRGRTMVLERHGATLANLPAILKDMGHRLVDVFAQNRENKDGKPHTLLTFVFSTQPREISEARSRELAMHDNDGLMTALFTNTRWGTVIAYGTSDDSVSAMLMSGETVYPERVITVDDATAASYGLVVTKAGRNPKTQAQHEEYIRKKNAAA